MCCNNHLAIMLTILCKQIIQLLLTSFVDVGIRFVKEKQRVFICYKR